MRTRDANLVSRPARYRRRNPQNAQSGQGQQGVSRHGEYPLVTIFCSCPSLKLPVSEVAGADSQSIDYYCWRSGMQATCCGRPPSLATQRRSRFSDQFLKSSKTDLDPFFEFPYSPRLTRTKHLDKKTFKTVTSTRKSINSIHVEGSAFGRAS